MSAAQIFFLGTGPQGCHKGSDTHGVTALMADLPAPPSGIQEDGHVYAVFSDSWLAHYYWNVDPRTQKGHNAFFSVVDAQSGRGFGGESTTRCTIPCAHDGVKVGDTFHNVVLRASKWVKDHLVTVVKDGRCSAQGSAAPSANSSCTSKTCRWMILEILRAILRGPRSPTKRCTPSRTSEALLTASAGFHP